MLYNLILHTRILFELQKLFYYLHILLYTPYVKKVKRLHLLVIRNREIQ